MEYPEIPMSFKTMVPLDFVNDLDGWSLTKDKVINSKGRLIHLDVDFGMSCSLKCPMCFRKDGNIDNHSIFLDNSRLTDTILEAKNIGLESVRILGAGEPFENDGIIKFLAWLKDEKLKPVVFTQGHCINERLAEKIAETNTSIMMRYDSFDEKIVTQSTGRGGMKVKKDHALEILADVGLNRHNPTHLGIVAPITSYTIDGIFEVYRFFRERNIYPLIPFIACAGRSVLPDGSIKDDAGEEKKIELAMRIYKYNLSKGIPYEGISPYLGGHICTLLSNGFYLTSTGLALRCEGDDTSILGDLKSQSIAEIWENSQNNRRFGGRYNYHCPPKDGRTIPNGFYKKVEEKLRI